MLDFQELRDFGGGRVLGFRMAHAGSPADGSLPSTNRSRMAKSLNARLAIMDSNRAMILAWPVTGAVSGPKRESLRS